MERIDFLSFARDFVLQSLDGIGGKGLIEATCENRVLRLGTPMLPRHLTCHACSMRFSGISRLGYLNYIQLGHR